MCSDRLENLKATHRQYCAYNQVERADCKLMSRLGHPWTEGYTGLRAFFDSLKYACNSGARLFAYEDAAECAEYWAPRLELSWQPQDIKGFSRVYPSDPQWESYIQACADAGWPKGCGAWLEAGTWHIRTRRGELKEAIEQLIEATARPPEDFVARPFASTSVVLEGRHYTVQFLSSQDATDFHEAVVSLVAKHQGASVLERRTAADDVADKQPLPLSEKRLMLGNVSTVTVTARTVLVPLVRVGASAEELLPLVHSVEALLEQGLPFTQAQHWLKRFVSAQYFKRLERKFATA